MAIQPCACLDAGAPHTLFDRNALGTAEHFSDISLNRCRTCGRSWLHYALAFEGFTGSGRWYRGQIDAASVPAPRDAARVFQGLPGYLAGGSYYGGQVHRRRGPVETHERPAGSPIVSSTRTGTSGPPPALPSGFRPFVVKHDDGDPHFPPHVALSPDGRCAFTTRSVAAGRTSVWIDGFLLTEIPGTSVHPCPFWSAGGGSLGLHIVHLEQQLSAIIIVPDLKGEGELLYQNDLLDAPEPGAWSPSGRSIAFLRTRTPKHEFTRAGAPELAVLDIETGEFFPVGPPGEISGRLRWVDGRTLEVGSRVFTFLIPV